MYLSTCITYHNIIKLSIKCLTFCVTFNIINA
nr:MAG TPA: hypothetical protein [Caudoviricetes sp.]